MKKTLLIIFALTAALQGNSQVFTKSQEESAMRARTVSRTLDVAPYYFENNYLPSRIKAIPKGGSFIYITDTHECRGNGNSLAVPAYVKDHAKGIKTAVYGGDCINWAHNAAEAMELVGLEFDYFKRVFSDGLVWVHGNHDCNSYACSPKIGIDQDIARVSDVAAYETTVKKLSGRIVPDAFAEKKIYTMKLPGKDAAELTAWANMHYYYDDPVAKVRIIVIETGDNGYTVKFTLKKRLDILKFQEDFLRNALYNTPKGYNVAVIGHMFGGIKDGEFSSGNAPVIRAVREFNASRKEHAIIISGHFHVDNAFAIKETDGKFAAAELVSGSKIPEGETLLLWISCDSNASYEKYAHANGLKHSVANSKMTKGTTDEHCFDVVTFTKDKLVLTRFGAGSDREFIF